MKINLDNTERIIEDYMPLILATIKRFKIYDRDEAIDESKMVTIKAIMDYDYKKSSFGHHLKLRLNYHFLEKAKEERPLSLDYKNKEGDEFIDIVASDIDIEKDLLERERDQILRDNIKKLRQKDREILRLRFIENLSHKEVGERLGMSEKTSKNRQSKAIRKLREIYGLG